MDRDDPPQPTALLLQTWLQALEQPEASLQPGDTALIDQLSRPPDLDLIGALIGLKQEVGLQGRTFRELSRHVESFTSAATDSSQAIQRRLEQLEERLEERIEARPEARSEVPVSVQLVPASPENTPTHLLDPTPWAQALEEARARGRDESAADLLEVRDRLARGLEDAQTRLDAIGGLRGLFTDRRVLEAVVEGMALSLARLDDLLRRLDIRELALVGGGFDPTTMRVLEVEERSDLPEGEVLEVIRPGFRRGQRLLRPAEVRVSRRR